VKADFYSLFKSAYASLFTEANIYSAFKRIWPIDWTIVTKKFDYRTPPEQTNNIRPSYLSPADWKRTQQLLEQVVKDNNDKLVWKLKGLIHCASTQNKLLQLKNEGLLTLLNTKNKRAKRSRRLPLRGKQKQPTNAVFYSP
jgi:hypothetical protein